MLLAPVLTAALTGRDARTKLDCGVTALFILLRLEGRSITLERVESALPPRHPAGYSMAELSAAAGSLGLPLEGVRLSQADKPLDRPAIAFVSGAAGGHFAVLRPVGTTGTMVQVIDPPRAPWIADYARVFAASTWTGRVLVPADPWLVRNAGALSASAAVVVLVAVGVWRGLAKRITHASSTHGATDSEKEVDAEATQNRA
jgi:hypothetical protein